MSRKPPPHLKWLHHLPKDLQQALRDLPEPLQDAVHDAVAARNPLCRPRLYTQDWLEELYHEAISAAWDAQRQYDPVKGCVLYSWGLRVRGQRLQVFCDEMWVAARRESAYPSDEETGEEVEFPDERASEQIEEALLVCEVRAMLCELGGLDDQIGLWYLFDGWSERAIAKRFGKSKGWVHKRFERILDYVRDRCGKIDGKSGIEA